MGLPVEEATQAMAVGHEVAKWVHCRASIPSPLGSNLGISLTPAVVKWGSYWEEHPGGKKMASLNQELEKHVHVHV